jgi:hypothetical protein
MTDGEHVDAAVCIVDLEDNGQRLNNQDSLSAMTRFAQLMWVALEQLVKCIGSLADRLAIRGGDPDVG